MRIPISIQRQIHPLFSPLAFFSLASPTKVCPSKPYLRKYLAFAMASEGGDSKSISTVVDNDEDVQFGFKRSEMYSSNLAGTVEPPYERHVFLCYESHESWPSRVEDSEADLLPKLLAAAIKTRKADMKVKTRLTICEVLDGGKLSDGDVLIFPDMIYYRDIKESDVDSFVDDVLVNGNPWSVGSKDVLKGSYVFVCAHNNRDKRCGVCGPVLIEKFKEEIESKGLKDNVFVTACSHIGGHKYAGNAIIFNANTEGKIEGHWYGYVTPDDVPELLDQHIGKGEIIKRIWRGQMGASVEEDNGIQNQKLEGGKELKNHEENSQRSGSTEIKESISSCSPAMGQMGASVEEDNGIQNQKLEDGKKHTNHEENPQGSISKETKEVISTCCQDEAGEGFSCCQGEAGEGFSCCQGEAGEGFSCCQGGNPAENLRKKRVGKSSKTVENSSRLVGKLEQSNVLTAVGVIGAVVAVAVIYGFYRRSH